MSISGMTTAVSAAEQAWQDAYYQNERIGSARTLRAEQAAWTVYSELCDEAQQCLQPGCRITSPDYAYCPEHREP
jgi:hypothetical protein